MDNENCRLCGYQRLTLVNQDKRRAFYLCENCELISVPKRYWLSEDDEKKRYSLHNNTISNNGYVKFLSQMADEIQKVCGSNSRVLDFGSGADAVLSQLLNERSIDCFAYDPHFNRLLQDDNERFDIIVLCEVIEHLKNIREELEFVNKHLSKDGKIILRTQIYNDLSKFSGWWYAQDVTHINFFNEKSLQTTADLLGKELSKTGSSDIFLLG